MAVTFWLGGNRLGSPAHAETAASAELVAASRQSGPACPQPTAKRAWSCRRGDGLEGAVWLRSRSSEGSRRSPPGTVELATIEAAPAGRRAGPCGRRHRNLLAIARNKGSDRHRPLRDRGPHPPERCHIGGLAVKCRRGAQRQPARHAPSSTAAWRRSHLRRPPSLAPRLISSGMTSHRGRAASREPRPRVDRVGHPGKSA